MIPEARIVEIERRLEGQGLTLDRLDSRIAAQEQLGSQLASSMGGTGGFGGAPRFWIGKATTAITARSGTTPGSGTAEIYDARTGTLTATGATKAVKNAGPAISSGKYVRIDQDGFGIWWVDPEECE